MDNGVPFTDIYVDDEIIDRVGSVLRSTRYVKGPEVERFEAEFAEACNVNHAVGVSNGTAALTLAFEALGVGEGDRVVTPAHSFFASVSPALKLGAEPVFVDVDSVSYTIDPDALRETLESTSDVAAVVPVHLYGQVAEMDPITDIAAEFDIPVIEDACQAHLARRDGRVAGSIGDIGCFSFYPSKNMTVGGDGGMLVTDDGDVAETARALRDHGRTPDGVHRRLGLNYRLDEIKAAVGRVQLEHLPEWNRARNEAAGAYTEQLDGIEEVTPPRVVGDAFHVYHLYVILATDRDGLREYLTDLDIDTGIHYPEPLHRQPAIKDRVDPPEMPVAEELCSKICSLPMHPRITTGEIDYVIDSIEEYYA